MGRRSGVCDLCTAVSCAGTFFSAAIMPSMVVANRFFASYLSFFEALQLIIFHKRMLNILTATQMFSMVNVIYIHMEMV